MRTNFSTPPSSMRAIKGSPRLSMVSKSVSTALSLTPFNRAKSCTVFAVVESGPWVTDGVMRPWIISSITHESDNSSLLMPKPWPIR